MKNALAWIVALLAVAGASIGVVWWAANRPLPQTNVAALNDAASVVAEAWPDVTASTIAYVGATVTVTDFDGRIVATTMQTPTADALEAARQRALAAPVVVDGRPVSMVYVDDQIAAAELASRHSTARIATIAIIAATALAGAILTASHLRIIRPFRRLESFATRVAAGDLDAPLEMDRANIFGAWTESFDLMRAELASSRQREEALQESKRELVSQIGHDVRTPVASIAATAELLAATETSEARASRLGVIQAKAAQIETLMADLFSANESELAALSVTSIDFPSAHLVALITEADFEGRVRLGDVPECLLAGDPRRLAQVVDNIVANAYKYAGTPIDVTAVIEDDLLVVTFADTGPGVPDGELETIFARGVRGSNVGDAPGQGLGLFTCAYLMDRMGGYVSARNLHPGLGVEVGVPLAGRNVGPRSFGRS